MVILGFDIGAALTPDVSLFEYEVSFQLRSVQMFGVKNSGFETE